MIRIYEEFGVEFRVTFNANKTQCIKFGLIKDTLCKPVTLNNKMINWESNVNHIGNILNQKFENGDDLRKKKCHFIGSVNKMFSNFENVQSAVLLKLFQRYCCSFYGCTLWKLDRVVGDNQLLQLGIKLSGMCGDCHLLHIHVC